MTVSSTVAADGAVSVLLTLPQRCRRYLVGLSDNDCGNACLVPQSSWCFRGLFDARANNVVSLRSCAASLRTVQRLGLWIRIREFYGHCRLPRFFTAPIASARLLSRSIVCSS